MAPRDESTPEEESSKRHLSDILDPRSRSAVTCASSLRRLQQ